MLKGVNIEFHHEKFKETLLFALFINGYDILKIWFKQYNSSFDPARFISQGENSLLKKEFDAAILNFNHAKTLQSLESELKLVLCLLDKKNPKHNEERCFNIY